MWIACPYASSAASRRASASVGCAWTVARRLSALTSVVFASASLMQSHLAEGLPPEVRQSFPGLRTDAQRAIQFVRSTPGITCALVGMSRREHVEENAATAAVPPLTLDQYRALFAR